MNEINTPDGLLENIKTNDIVKFKFASIESVNMSFSIYKNIV